MFLPWVFAASAPALGGEVVHPVQPRIVGGQVATNGRYPYAQVSLQYDNDHYCGGTLIADELVLTAYHCWDNFDMVEFHRFDFSNSTEVTDVIPASGLFWHPEYDEDNYHFDVLIVKLSRPVSPESGLSPIRVNRESDIPASGQVLTAVGWGVLDDTDDPMFPTELHEVELKYIPPEFCEKVKTSDGEEFGQYLTSDMMCAGAVGKDSCYGDSGGPLILKGDTPDEDVQIGVVSWGISCAGNYPGVYSRLSESFDWIQAIVCAESKSPPTYFECTSNAPSTPPEPLNSDIPTTSNTCPCENETEDSSSFIPSIIPSEAPSVRSADRPTVGAHRVPVLGSSSSTMKAEGSQYLFALLSAILLVVM